MTPPHLDESADDIPHHAVEESLTDDLEENVVLESAAIHGADAPHRLLWFVLGTVAVAGEIVLTDESLAGVVHRRHIERSCHPPLIALAEDRRVATGMDAIEIALLAGVEARLRANSDRVGPEGFGRAGWRSRATRLPSRAVKEEESVDEPRNDSEEELPGVLDTAGVIYVVAGIPLMIAFFLGLFLLVGSCDGMGIQIPA